MGPRDAVDARRAFRRDEDVLTRLVVDTDAVAPPPKQGSERPEDGLLRAGGFAVVPDPVVGDLDLVDEKRLRERPRIGEVTRNRGLGHRHV
ncbi:hypothetical protein ACFQL0_05520 [Haloplanus litoreus]|uniref:hypothetical protein n=1 Tax=Haloplanus litoreus TaxID=767515 RepID=UPI00360F9ADC